MKKTLQLLPLLLLACICSFAQAPQAMNYQGIARYASGAAIASTNISLRLTFHSTSASGPIVYQETQSPTTNGFGLYNVAIGLGTASIGTFAAIPWSDSTMWMQVEIDPTGGTSYTTLGTNELLSVPYAIYSNWSNNAVRANYATSAGTAYTAYVADTVSGPIPMGGDVTGSNAVSTVVKLQGYSVSNITPAGGQALVWDATTSQWTPGTVSATGGVTSITSNYPLTGGTITTSGSIGLGTTGTAGTYGADNQVPVFTTDAYGRVTAVTNTNISGVTMGGDVTGTTNANTISSIQGKPVLATAPALNNVLQWNGTDWVPAAVSGTGSDTLIGDIVGTTITNTVSAIQGKPVSAAAPAINDVLQWNGTDWVPAAVSGAGSDTLIGDIVGTTITNTVSAIQGKPVSAAAPAVNDVLQWNGTDWVPAAVASGASGLSGSPSYLVKFTSASTGGNSSIIDSSAGLLINTTSYLNPYIQKMQFEAVPNNTTIDTGGNWMVFQGSSTTPPTVTATGPVGYPFMVICDSLGPLSGYVSNKGLIMTDNSSVADGLAGSFTDNAAYMVYSPFYQEFSINTMYDGLSYQEMYTDNTTGNVYFPGTFSSVNILGTLTKAAGTFKIDHPLDPENKYLSHSFVESPDMMNIYNGNITTDASGNATVKLPDYFEALNMDFRYQLTVMGETFAQAIVSKEIDNNQFQIRTNQPNIKVSWQVTGVRHDKFADAHRVVPEWDKEPKNKGKYLHPKEWGQPDSKGINYHPDASKVSKISNKQSQSDNK